MRKNGTVALGGTEMDYVAFGEGERTLVVLPGLSDGLATVKGKALLLSGPYKRFFKDCTVYIFSRKNHMPEGYGIAGSELYVYDGLGHGLFEEAKDFYDRVFAFCRA